MKTEMDAVQGETNKMVDQRLKYESMLDKKEEEASGLKEKIIKLLDEINGKDLAIKALSDTLYERGEENKKLAMMVSEIKNHQLLTQVIGELFAVTRINAFKNEDLMVRYQRLKLYSSNLLTISPKGRETISWKFLTRKAKRQSLLFA